MSRVPRPALALSATTAALFAIVSGSALAQPRGPAAAPEWREFSGVKRIDGSKLEAGFMNLPTEPGSGVPDLALQSPAVVMDGYTALVSQTDGGPPPESIVNENYSFGRPTAGGNAIRFIIPIKVPTGGLPGQMSVDVIVFPSRARTGTLLGGEDMPPSPTPRVFIDDVLIGNPGSSQTAYATFAFFNVENVEQAIGPGDFDWVALVEFNANSLSDLDSNGQPDVAIELQGGTPVYRFTPTSDEVGGSVLEFFAGNVNRVNVYEPAGPQPPARSGFPGMQVGETGVTRPWCFRIN